MKYHYYAANALGWAVAEDRDRAIKKLVNADPGAFQRAIKNAHKDGEPGIYIWTCRVHAEITADYKIEFCIPKGVEWSDSAEHYVTYVTSKEIAYWTKPEEVK